MIEAELVLCQYNVERNGCEEADADQAHGERRRHTGASFARLGRDLTLAHQPEDARRLTQRRRDGDGPHAHAAESNFSTARSRAASALGLLATSAGVGLRAPLFSSLTTGVAPHTHGRPGGQMHPPVDASRKRSLTM